MAAAALAAAVAMISAPVAEAQMKFLATGDWGGQDTWPYYTIVQQQVAAQMGKTGAAKQTQFNFGLGT